MANAVFSDINPDGKPPVAISRGAIADVLQCKAHSAARVSVRFDRALCPFGYGLSYSTFDIGMPTLLATKIATTGSVNVTVPIRNMSTRAGDETVQIQVRDTVSSVTRPIKELKAFRRVILAAGESRELTFTPEAFWMWSDKIKRVVELGDFEIMTGPDAVRLKSAMLTVVK